jgi:hypothetical protein
MAKTVYQPENAAFSNKAHMAARRLLYPRIFRKPESMLGFEDTLLHMGERGRILDGEMGIDRIIRVTVPSLHAPLVFTVQERFRRPQFAKYKDLTVTEWNNASETPSELYKINAGIFLYGYYDEGAGSFVDAIAISVTDLLLMLAREQINYSSEYNRKKQDFLAFRFDDLKTARVVIFRLSEQQKAVANYA